MFLKLVEDKSLMWKYVETHWKTKDSTGMTTRLQKSSFNNSLHS